jgi:hypothetical protein
MIRTVALFLLLFIGTFCAVFAQENKPVYKPRFSIRTNPFSFAEIDAGPMIGLGYQWSKKFSATFDPTFVFYNPYSEESVLGIKIRTDFRFHFRDRMRTFLAPEAHFKYARSKPTATFGINCLGGNCAYFMEAQYVEQKTEIGGSVKVGWILPLDQQERWNFEFYIGLGVKFRYFDEKSIPTGGSFVTPPHSNRFIIEEGDAIPMMPAFMKISYGL